MSSATFPAGDPKKIGKYEFQEFLGGGMSHVYRAWDSVMNRMVAVKILTAEATADPEAKARFLREAQTAGGLTHDNIIRVYEFGEEDGRPFMVMEFLQGEDLREAIRSGHVGDLHRKLEIALEAAKALEYIHEQSIVHRDIKPENLHLDTNGRIRLMDFGIAKRLELNLTRAGFTLGTPYYMAPEQVRGEEITCLADVYAFGILLFELLTGSKPITGASVEQLFYRILNEPLDLAPLREAGVPPRICELISRCTAKTPAERPGGMAEVRQELDRALRAMDNAGRPAVAERPPSTGEPGLRNRKRWLIPAAVAVVLIVAGVLYMLVRPQAAPEPGQVAGPIVTQPPPPSILSTPVGEMVLVEKGSFLFGKNNVPVNLPDYYIDKTEVTNAAYRRFCTEDNHSLPPGFPRNRLDYPVVNVTIADARAFAAWAGKRLPKATEWEKAARGTDGRLYPWGNTPDPSRANVANNPARPVKGLAPADSYASGASPFGALQMAGNVWELIEGLVNPSPAAVKVFSFLKPPATAAEPWVTMRGGPYGDPLITNVTYEWSAVPARFRAPNIGFRCVKDVR